jgi:hypothetical protein
MDLEETEARNDCAGEGQQQFNRTTDCNQSQSQLLYEWWFTANQFVLVTSPLTLTTRLFSTESLWYVTSSLTRRWVCPL